MSSLLYIEQFDEVRHNVEEGKLQFQDAKAQRQLQAANLPPKGDGLYDTFFNAAARPTVMTNRPFTLKDKLLFRYDLLAGNFRLTLKPN